MNLLEANNINNNFNYIFSDWAIALFIFFAILIILGVIFKGLKVGITLVAITAVLAGFGVLASFVYMLITWDMMRIIDFLIKWLPTILFVITVTFSTLVNAKRGLRKSLILLIQAVVACVVCTVFYYVCVTSEEVDKAVLGIINQIIGGNTLQGLLGVSEECSTVRQIISEWLPKVMGGDMQILLSANPEYIVTLVDMVFRIVFALVASILYLILVFLFYIIYFIAYPERRYKKKKNRAAKKNPAARPYKKNHAGGGAVGLVRGITVGLLSLSFVGSALFMVTGGPGAGTLGDYDFENDDYNLYYSIYRSVDSYGAQGIFKVLNSMRDANDTPFYLFAADMVLSGKLEDEDNDVDELIKFREEIGAYTGFAKETLNLLMKYGEEDMVAIINGRGGENSFNTIVDIMSTPEFRTEFDLLIKNFDAPKYTINLGMALLNTVVDHIDEISFTSSLGEDSKDLLKLLFKADYLSDTIPDERQLKQDIEEGKISADKVEARPHLKISHLITKDDIRIALEIAFSILSGEQDVKDTMGLIKALLPEVRQLSILQTSRSKELDPVLSRMFCYVENKYLTAEGEDGITYAEVKDRNVKWIDELNMLMDITGDALTLWGNIYKDGIQPLDMLLSIFDESNENYDVNLKCFNNIRSTLEQSSIIGTVMSTSFMSNMLTNALTSISANIYIPKNIEFTRRVDSEGNLVDEGELHRLLSGFMLLTTAKEGKFLDEVLNAANGETVDINAILSALSDALVSKDSDNRTLSYYLTESQLLRSLISSVMIDMGAQAIFVPEVALEKVDGDVVKMITRSELLSLLDNLPKLLEFVGPLLTGGNIEDHIDEIIEYILTDDFDALLTGSRICEGTAAHLLMDFLGKNEYIVVPAELLKSEDGWMTSNGKQGELRNLLTALKAVDIDFAKIMSGEVEMQEMFNTLLNLKEEAVDDLLGSRILHYTLSKFLLNGTETSGFKFAVPYGARQPAQTDDPLEFLVQKGELKALFKAAAQFDFSGDMDTENMFNIILSLNDDAVDAILDSQILHYTLSGFLLENTETLGFALKVPYGAKEQADPNDDVDFVVKKQELKALFKAVAQLDLSGDVDTDKLFDIVLSLNDDAVGAILDSQILHYTLSGFLLENTETLGFALKVPYGAKEQIQADEEVEIYVKKDEFRYLLKAVAKFDLSGGMETDSLLDTISALNEEEIDELLNSQILHYTLSDYLLKGTDTTGFKLIVPGGAKEQTGSGDAPEIFVKKEEFKLLLKAVAEFDLSGDMDISSMLYTVVTQKQTWSESLIMSASIVYAIASNGDVTSAISLPDKFIKAGEEEALLNYNEQNAWYAELPNFIDALDEILGISESGENFEFNTDNIQNSLSSLLTNLNEPSQVNGDLTKLEICYGSEIVKNEITARLDDAFLSNEIVGKDVIDSAKDGAYYKQSELEALSYAFKIFGLDLSDPDSGEIAQNVTASALSLNTPFEEGSEKTKLNLIYRSVIIMHIFSEQIDSALKGNIDVDVLDEIKKSRTYYEEEEIAAFIDAANEMKQDGSGDAGMDGVLSLDVSNLGDLNASSQKFPGKTRLQVIYSSNLIAGVITKTVREGLYGTIVENKKIDHPKAYRDEIHIYKMEEIESLFTIFGDLSKDSIKLNRDNLDKISGCLYDAEEGTRSYLLVAAISALISDNNNFIIPADATEETEEVRYVSPRECALIISVFGAMTDELDFAEMGKFEIVTIPDKDTRDILFSSEIMRATITGKIGESSDEDIYVSTSADIVKCTTDVDGKNILILSAAELEALANAIVKITNEGSESEFKVPKISLANIIEYSGDDTLDTLLASNVLYYSICDVLLTDPMAKLYFESKGYTEEWESYSLTYSYGDEVTATNVKVVKEEAIAEYIDYYKTLPKLP